MDNSDQPRTLVGKWTTFGRGETGPKLTETPVEPFDLDLWTGGQDGDDDDCVQAEVEFLRARIDELGLVSESPRHVDLNTWVPGDEVDEDDGLAVEILALREQLAEHEADEAEGDADPVDLDTWEPGEDAGQDSKVADEVRSLRAQVAGFNAPAPARPKSEYAQHVAKIGEEAGFHPSEGVMPALLNCILERGDDEVSQSVGKLTAEDLGDLYDAQLGRFVDDLEGYIAEYADYNTRPAVALTWGPAGSFPGVPNMGSVSTALSNGGSVMIAPDPNSGNVEVVYFTPGGDAKLLLTNAGSIEAGKALVESKTAELLAMGEGE